MNINDTKKCVTIKSITKTIASYSCQNSLLQEEINLGHRPNLTTSPHLG